MGKVRLDLYKAATCALGFVRRDFDKARVQIDFSPVEPFQFSATQTGKRADRNVRHKLAGAHSSSRAVSRR